MSISQIKRGVYTRVSASGIESNEGTFFEAIMAPTHDIEITAPNATTTQKVEVKKSFFSVVSVTAAKVGAGGAGDALTLNRVRGSSTVPICTFDVATAGDGQVLLPNGDFDTTVTDIQPGDSLTLVSNKATNPSAEVHLRVRID